MTASNMKKPFSWPPLLLVLALIAVGIYWLQSEGRKAEVSDTAGPATQVTGFNKALAKGAMAALLVHAERKDVAPFDFSNDKGETTTLSRWKGRVVLLNLWATWCAPCRKEMPELAALQKDLGGPDFEIVALSIDRKGFETSAAFLKEINVNSLALYIEPEGKSLAALQALGLPATILIDRQGKEAARLLGPASWHSDEAKAVIKALIAEKP